MSDELGRHQAKPGEATRNPVRSVIANDDSAAGAAGVNNLKSRRLIRGKKRVTSLNHANVPGKVIPQTAE
jgi:hypothetical protein